MRFYLIENRKVDKMKFVHAADMHLDRPFVTLGGNKEMIKRKKLEQKYVFKKLIDYVKSNNVELLFLSGDIFTLSRFFSNFKKEKFFIIFFSFSFSFSFLIKGILFKEDLDFKK